MVFRESTSKCNEASNMMILILGKHVCRGGVLGIALLQFLGDSNEYLEKLSSKGYPFAFLLAISGYLLAMLADCVCIYVYRKRKSREAVAQQRNTSTNIASSSTGTSQSRTQVVDICGSYIFQHQFLQGQHLVNRDAVLPFCL